MKHSIIKRFGAAFFALVISLTFFNANALAAGETITGGIIPAVGQAGTVSTTSITARSHAPLSVIHATLTLTNGWNVFSTPRTLSGIGFSNNGTGINFYQLQAGSWTGTTVAANTTNVKPLEGFLINNTTGSSVTMDLSYYVGTLSAGQKIFTKSLSAGWNVVGVADSSLVSNTSNFTELSVQTGVNSLSGDYSHVIDWTDADFDGGDNTLTIDQLKQITSNDVTDTTEKFEEFKAYAVFVKQGGGSYGGTQL